MDFPHNSSCSHWDHKTHNPHPPNTHTNTKQDKKPGDCRECAPAGEAIRELLHHHYPLPQRELLEPYPFLSPPGNTALQGWSRTLVGLPHRATESLKGLGRCTELRKHCPKPRLRPKECGLADGKTHSAQLASEPPCLIQGREEKEAMC